VIIGLKYSQHQVREKGSHKGTRTNSETLVSQATTLKVEVHRVIENIDQEEDKFAAVKVNKDITNTGETETALQPVCPQSKSRGRRTIEIASFDHVFAPYIKPPA